jgi:hypothetical protein
MTLTLTNMLRAIPLVAVALAPEIANASNVSCGEPYYDPCDALSGWVDISMVSTGKIPIDGVLVLQGAVQGTPPGPDSVVLSVTTGDVPLAGTIELTSVPGTVIWRPDAPWAAGATYLISGTASNAEGDGTCLPVDLPISGEVTIDAAPAPALDPASLAGVELENFIPTISLETLACCEGVGPSANPGGCGSDPINYDPAQCTPTEGTGYFDLSLSAAPVPTGPVAQQVAYRFNIDNQPGPSTLAPMFDLAFLSAPVCASVDVIDLGSKAVVPGPQKCFGEGLAAKLGVQPLDVTDVLDCPFQTCAPNTNYDGWDLNNCTPPGDSPTTGPTDAGGGDDSSGGGSGGADGDKACACDASPRPGAGLLMMIGALGLARRRRSRPRPG